MKFVQLVLLTCLSISQVHGSILLETNRNALSVASGSTFTLSLSMRITEAELVTGLTYYWQVSPSASGMLSLTNREIGPSPFSVLNFSNATITSAANGLLNPVNNNDLGGGLQDLDSPLGTGTWLIGTYTFSVNAGLPPGLYTLSLADTPSAIAVGESPDFTEISFTSTPNVQITVIPEPSSLCLGIIAALFLSLARRRRKTKRLAAELFFSRHYGVEETEQTNPTLS